MVMRSCYFLQLVFTYTGIHNLSHKNTKAIPDSDTTNTPQTWRQLLTLYVFEHQTCSSRSSVQSQVIIITHTRSRTHSSAMFEADLGALHGEQSKQMTQRKCTTDKVNRIIKCAIQQTDLHSFLKGTFQVILVDVPELKCCNQVPFYLF